MEKYKSRAFKRTISWYLKRKIHWEWYFQSFPENHILGKIRIRDDFFIKKMNFPRNVISGKLWKYRSQSILRFRYHEIVRLKALDLYCSKIKKLYILPQCPLIYVTVEDISKSLKIAILSFTKKYPSSMLAETKGDWGRIKIFSIFQKYGSRTFKRTISHVFWVHGFWDIFI